MTMTTAAPETIILTFSQGNSNKIYQAELKKEDPGFIVNFAYGRIGSTLRTGTKTQTPIPYEKAKMIYSKLIKSKLNKGYSPDDSDNGTKYLHSSDQKLTGIHCQLLNPIDESEVASKIQNDQWWMQEKMDGRRMLIHKDSEATAINRKGLSVGAPTKIIQSAESISETFVVDGEAINDTLHVFDLLFFNGEDLKYLPYSERYKILCSIGFKNGIKIVPVVKTSADKQALLNELEHKNREGVVFKKHSSTYQAGRPNSGGDQIKFKFYETASVIVTTLNDKRSVGISVVSEGKQVSVGNVTIPPNHDVPKLGYIVEVRYLYAYKKGSLYQPNYLGKREAIDAHECVIEQLKYKCE